MRERYVAINSSGRTRVVRDGATYRKARPLEWFWLGVQTRLVLWWREVWWRIR